MQALILDVDGTLWDCNDVVASAWSDAARSLGVLSQEEAITLERLNTEVGKPPELIAESLFPHLTKEKLRQVLDESIRYVEVYLENCQRDLTYEGVGRTIKELSESRELYIVSNCQSGYIEIFLRKYGLGEFITDFECSGNTGCQKGENIRTLMERNQVQEAVYVGDTQGDYLAARFAGIPFVYAAYGFGIRRGMMGKSCSFLI